jgi:thiosulfate/3-mercaptopyruvate sulfurtransferase
MNEHQGIISPEWLADHLEDSNVIVIDCRFRLNDPQWGKKQDQRALDIDHKLR